MSLTTTQIAAGIDAHLKSFAGDEELNRARTLFWRAFACASGGWVHVTYVAYQGSTAIRKAEALAYLDALNAGYVGKHWNVPAREAL